MNKLLLASSSPFRKDLLARLKLPFETYAPDIDETPRADETMMDLVTRLSIDKARAAAKKFPYHICIGSDELGVLHATQTILGKPLTHENAVAQLQQMSGQQVSFYTGVCVFVAATEQYECDVAITHVFFKTLSTSMIENYLLKEKPYNSAASFKSETLGSALVSRYETDDPTAIIGLPLVRLCGMLERAGMSVI